MRRAATPAIAVLRAADVPFEVLHYRHDPRSGSFGAEAVEELTATAGVDRWQIVKTLVIALPDGLAVAVLPVPATLSLKAAARAFGVPRAVLADRAAAERSTGYVIGGISPFGQRRKLPTVVDASVLAFDRVVCSAGKRGLDVAVGTDDLIRLTDAVTAEIAGP
ncbi:aminoacyl-tRNA deacylase [Mycolicibacterium thermoresistibile]